MMYKMKGILFTFSVVAIALMMVTGTWASNGSVVKWSQPPDMEYGVNIPSTEDSLTFIVADDWQCRDPRQVTDVHFWGSYIGWQDDIPDPGLPTPGVNGFMIRIYEDVPEGPQNLYSHPGARLYEKRIGICEERYVASIPHPGGTYEHKFYYSLDLPEPFIQEEGTIYWISIAAIMPQGYKFPWGWETSDFHWNDDACKYDYIELMWVEITPGMLPNWYPHNTVDMAFELTVPYEPPPPLEPIKWQQRPDMEHGLNIISTPNIDPPSMLTVADDWLCLDGSPVSDLHFWGSYPYWENTQSEPPDDPPGVHVFRIQVYSDAPATTPGEFSRPDKLLYEVWVDNFSEDYVGSFPVNWPPGAEFEHKYRYDLDLPRIFWQQRDRIYWLNISAIPRDSNYLWGWESSMDRWNDVAVSGWYEKPDNWSWNPIVHPVTEEPIDMSFELTTCEGPIKWLQFPDMADGINILSLPDNPVVADDWLCTNGKPVTEVHFWGSYLNRGGAHWEQYNPGPPAGLLPPSPGVEYFKLSFHKDVPAGVDPNMPWSHPGQLLKEVWIDFNNMIERYWDSIPHTDPSGELWWEHKFYYTVRLESPFEQEEGVVYWLDIGAKPNPESQWHWGWETSKDHWNDNAVIGDGIMWMDLGRQYFDPIDMAFLLITPDDTPYCEGDYDRDGDVDGSDLATFAADFGRTNCYYTGDCEGDMDYDGDVDGSDLAVFAADFGRTDCPCKLPPVVPPVGP